MGIKNLKDKVRTEFEEELEEQQKADIKAAKKEGGLSGLKNQINAMFGKDIIFSPADQLGIVDIPRFSSGSLSIDIAAGGGWPENKVIEVIGPESCGKTFLIDNSIKTITNRSTNNKFLLIDEEGSADTPWLKRIGINLKNLEIVRSQYAEQALDILELATQSGQFAGIALDSIAALIPKEELDASTEDWQMGLQARLVNKACRKAYRALNESRRNGGATTIFLINQIRLKIGVQWGNPETTPGGNGPKFASSIRLDMRKKEMMKDKNEEVYGQTTGCTFIKNKTAPPLKKCDIVYHVDGPYKGQMDNYIVLASIGLEMDTIKKSGSWFEGKWLTARCQGLKKVSENLRAQDKKLLNSYIPAIQERYLDSAPLMFRF